MNAKITKKRMKQMLSYDWLKMVVFAVLIVVGTELLFTVFGDRISAGEEFIVYAYDVNVQDDVDDIMTGLVSDGKLSYDIRKYSFTNLGSYSSSNYTVSQQLAAYASVGQGDIFLLSDKGRETADDEGNVTNESLFCSMATAGYLYDLDALLSDAKEYLRSVGGFDEDGNYSETQIRNYFLKRCGNDNRYRKGLISADDEVARLVTLYNNVKKYETLLDKDIWVKYDVSEDKTAGEKTYGINVGKLTGGAKPAAQFCNAAVYDEDGNITAEGAVMGVFNYKSYQPDHMFEVFAFINNVVETYSDLFVA